MSPPRDPKIAIVGAGMSGICMGAKLRMAGLEDFTIFEKGSDLGGTWRDNTYPGLTCDVPSHFYQFSFHLNPDWSHTYSPGAEIWHYLNGVSEHFGLRARTRFGQEIASARYEDGRWQLRTASGDEHSADFLISASGVLHHPKLPGIEGLESFAGDAFHSARWDHSVGLGGRRIGIIGTGSTAVQIVSEVAERVGSLSLFQRTPQWVLPLSNRRYSRLGRAANRRFGALNEFRYRSSAWVFERFTRALIEPCWQRSLVSTACRLNMRKIKDPELRARLTPSYEPMCKRLVVSSRFYDAMQRDNVALVTDPIARVVPSGIETADGKVHQLDVLVLATGFDPRAFMRPIEMTGLGGVTLDEAWSDGPRAYLTVALPGFPNHFMLIGPHSPFGNHSLMPIAETQSDYAIGWIRRWQAGEVETASPTEEATAAYNEAIREAMPSTIWASGCDSWYIGPDGLPGLWPWTPERHRQMLAEPQDADYDLTT